MTNLSDIIEKETGKQLVIQESILMLPEEVEEVIGNKPESDILVHTAYDESTDENVMLLTSDAPEYKPWALVIQDSNGENKIKML
ncbi:uracil-DNA-glycosylase inhibitor [Bacillus phage AR9]|uniref:Uracil-DNA glycosylase inhibitor n=5 Tax=Caudoviricetes TaxID=2731619 RepID=UNGI_BPPB2|nr:uracil-DNA-glycosylase inhibitor [Bacillus phage AR9]YP_009664501.1 uracil-DNA glycosylase inhibitor [Bacillus phage PBS1]P14739.1 RecName: Full=Uracil-DNA glycosylase inhibitor [Bacillus phage PBS2]1EUI_C Chain C, URACIL-DNA GLYCOSYLASE INHIBITOR PROTEIN [Bacillus phage PBS2]1EUI_D Chain D, URACIL-DNA GLYCOSYLASE INHIBITOR PROTEIN [Bacillus phage PBS2]1LQG_C Chain C, URACIL-DNA GLYCOSYLASE INHIBITOR [Bacillus phage PBS2]1LQG_D Chain D, URACIL-DNA GLYCOSYLASE INHIBITOR [Bacillus phage PBS2